MIAKSRVIKDRGGKSGGRAVKAVGLTSGGLRCVSHSGLKPPQGGLSKAFDDAIVALYQNGERLMPGNGYPMRMFLPGWEGNMNTKYLRRIKLTDGPAMSYHEARTYTDPMPNGKPFQFYFIQEVKSFITSPSPGMGPRAPGYVEISGIAYSGTGRIKKVTVSADGGHNLG